MYFTEVIVKQINASSAKIMLSQAINRAFNALKFNSTKQVLF